MSDTDPSAGSFVDDVHGWTMHHFSIAKGSPTEVLRAVADAIDQLGDVNVFDITYKKDFDDKKSMTVYFAFPE